MTDYNDLPEELREQLRLGTRAKDSAPVLVYSVLSETPMTLNDVIVAVWEQHGRVLKRSTAMAALASLRNDGEVISEPRGTYALAGDDDYEEAA